MPTMPRIDDKCKKIAYKILGVPANMQDDMPKKKKELEKRLTFEETTYMR